MLLNNDIKTQLIVKVYDLHFSEAQALKKKQQKA